MSASLVDDLQGALRALEDGDGDAIAAGRGALARARAAWPTLGQPARGRVAPVARELRERVDALAAQSAPDPAELLARAGFERFRAGQREAVQAALAGRDSLVVMPTGGGKSLCYQLPALAGRGLVVVVSPLIALMADQASRARELGLRAVMLASGMGEGEAAASLGAVRDGEAQLVLVAPERFASASFRAVLATRPIALFVVDEAHCVSEWGHDFRPDYLRLQRVLEDLGRPPAMAATATATPQVSEEIVARLGLRDPVRVRSSFDRPNLSFDVACFEGKGAMARKHAALTGCLGRDGGLPAIVYCGTRRQTEALAAALAGEGLRAVAYHAGLAPEVRRRAQAAFMGGEAEVVVATNAFGMGVDKADVRSVAHWAIPTSLEAYYQEAGRAGRDGAPARALLLASRVDLGRLIRFNTERQTRVEDVRAFVAALQHRARDGVVETDGPLDGERLLLAVAERAGAVELAPATGGRLRIELRGPLDGARAHRALQISRDRGWQAYRAIERFIATPECRRAQVLAHFGDSGPGAPTGRCCDVCEPDGALVRAVSAEPAARSRRARGEGAGAAGSAGGGDHAAEVPVDAEAFERLRAWRWERAEGKPAYTVATDATLRELIRERPATPQELIAIRGIGPSFCERHGESVLELLRGG
jgi:ATP-dependent DNA helicase RecQ